MPERYNYDETIETLREHDEPLVLIVDDTPAAINTTNAVINMAYGNSVYVLPFRLLTQGCPDPLSDEKDYIHGDVELFISFIKYLCREYCGQIVLLLDDNLGVPAITDDYHQVSGTDLIGQLQTDELISPEITGAHLTIFLHTARTFSYLQEMNITATGTRVMPKIVSPNGAGLRQLSYVLPPNKPLSNQSSSQFHKS